jgi:transposase-like protein
MAKPYVSSSQRRDFSLFEIAEFSEHEAFMFLAEQRWKSRDQQICPACSVIDKHYFRKNRNQWRCKHCDRCFSVTSGTPLADHKLGFKKMLMAIFLYSSSVKSISCVDMSAKLKIQVKTAHMLIGKLRECLLRQRDASPLSGTVHVDGGHFGGKPRKPNVRRKPDARAIADKVEQQMSGKKKKAPPQYGYAGTRSNIERRKNRRIVMVMREIYPEKGKGAHRTIVSIAMSEDSASAEALARHYITDDTLIMSDENAAYARLSQWYDHKTVEHAKEFSTIDGVNENQAESFYSRLRRCEYGVVHRITPKYLMDLANEIAWREDTRRTSEGETLRDLLQKLFKNGLSRWWRGYHQGHHRAIELLMI